MMDISLLDPAAIAFVLGLVVPLFIYTAKGARANPTGNRLARSNVTGFLDSLLSDNGTNITLTSGQLLVPDGSASAASLARSANVDTGLYFSGDSLIYTNDGTARVMFDASGNQYQSTGLIRFASGVDVTGATGLWLAREANAVLQQGEDSGTPIAQTFKGPDGSGTDIAGGDLTSAPGRGTGTGVGGTFRIATAPAGASGSTQNALVDRLIIGGAGVGSMADLTVSSLTGAAGYRGIATMNSGTTIASVAATAAQSGAVILTQILQYVGDVNSQAGFSTAVQSVRAGAFEIVAVGSRAPVNNAPIAWFVLR